MIALLALALVFGLHSESVRPHIYVVDMSPFTVRGRAFQPGERVKVTVYAHTHVTTTVTAGDSGRFSVRMRSVKYDQCPRYGVRAIGNKGSRASIKAVPECANLAPPLP